MKKKALVLWCLLVSAAVLFLCSKSSPGYPINDWSDANIYFTIGKGMTRGQVVYRDLYDHKGPLLYALHALCALVSFESFLGVYLMELLLLACALYSAVRLFELFGVKRSAAALVPIMAVVIASSFSFAEGDSAEEMLLPLAMGTLTSVCAFLNGEEQRMSAKSLILNGVLTGCAFWIKFTMIGLHMGLLGWVLIRHLLKKEWKHFFACVGWLAAGFGLATAPWLVYFGLNGAIADWLKVYLWDNLFLYSGAKAGLMQKAKAMALSGWDWFSLNLRYTLLIVLGLGYFALKEKKSRPAVLLSAVCAAVLVFIGGKSYPYYGLALAALTAPGLIAVGRVMEKYHPPRALAAVSLAACLAACPFISHNMTADYGAHFLTPKEDTMQHRIAAHLPKDAQLLNYGFMDAGFYTAASAVPEVKYFHQTNVPLEEMTREQRRYVDEALMEYVVARAELTPQQQERYELIAEEKSPNFWYEKVYLYRRKP